MKMILMGLMALIFTGCATTGKYEAKLRSWVGRSESELVSSWGIPSSTYDADFGKLLMYRGDGGQQTTLIPNGNMVTAYTQNNWCETTFTVDKIGLITNWSWKGNSCKSE